MPITTAVDVVRADDSAATEAMAVAGFLAGYCGATRRSYATDLRLLVPGATTATWRCSVSGGPTWSCSDGGWRRAAHALHRGSAPLHPGQLYRYCEQEHFVPENPAHNVRRPKVDYESRTLGLDRNELG